MSERKHETTSILRCVYARLEKQGTCYGAWWGGESPDYPNRMYCLEGALEIEIGINHRDYKQLEHHPAYSFLLKEARLLHNQKRMDKLTPTLWNRLFYDKERFEYVPAMMFDSPLYEYNDVMGYAFIMELLSIAIAKSKKADQESSKCLLEYAMAA